MNIRVEIISELKRLREQDVYRIAASDLGDILDMYSADQMDFALRNMVRDKKIEATKDFGVMFYFLPEKAKSPIQKAAITKAPAKIVKSQTQTDKKPAAKKVKPAIETTSKKQKPDKSPRHDTGSVVTHKEKVDVRYALSIIEKALLKPDVKIDRLELKVDTLKDIARMFNEKVSPILLEIAGDLEVVNEGKVA